MTNSSGGIRFHIHPSTRVTKTFCLYALNFRRKRRDAPLDIILVQLVTGVAYGMLYFMIAAGLTIILGVMNVVNLAHGTLFMLGSYIGFFFY